jgi:hypothetical protein
VVRTIRHAHCDQVRVEHLNLDAQFLQPPVQKHGVGAHPMTHQHRMLLDDVGCGLGHAPRRASNPRGWKNAPALRHFSPYLFTLTRCSGPVSYVQKYGRETAPYYRQRPDILIRGTSTDCVGLVS